MASSFGAKKSASPWRQQILPILLFVLVAVLFIWGVSGMEDSTGSERQAMVERAVTRAVVQCYALEGQYPSSVAYLRENYGLAVDEKQYFVRLDFMGGNIMPHITVLENEEN